MKSKNQTNLFIGAIIAFFLWLFYKEKKDEKNYDDFVNRPFDTGIDLPVSSGIPIPTITSEIPVIVPFNPSSGSIFNHDTGFIPFTSNQQQTKPLVSFANEAVISDLKKKKDVSILIPRNYYQNQTS